DEDGLEGEGRAAPDAFEHGLGVEVPGGGEDADVPPGVDRLQELAQVGAEARLVGAEREVGWGVRVDGAVEEGLVEVEDEYRRVGGFEQAGSHGRLLSGASLPRSAGFFPAGWVRCGHC